MDDECDDPRRAEPSSKSKGERNCLLLEILFSNRRRVVLLPVLLVACDYGWMFVAIFTDPYARATQSSAQEHNIVRMEEGQEAETVTPTLDGCSSAERIHKWWLDSFD